MKDRIKQIRKNFKITQTEFGRRIGLKQNTIAAYERGRGLPSDVTINNICKEFGINEKWLRTGEGEPYIDISKKAKLARFFGEVMADEDESFRIKFLEALASYTHEDWKMLEIILSKMPFMFVNSLNTIEKEKENTNE